MSKKILQFIVIILALLILFCFGALIYGMYLKIAKNQNNIESSLVNNYKLNLQNNEKIINIEVMENQKLLFTVSKDDNIYAIIYDLNKKNIESKIMR